MAWPAAVFPRSISLSDRVHVVRIALDAYGDAAALVPLLDDEERIRAERFRQSRHRRRFIAAHAIARVVLGWCLHIPPAALRFTTGPHGKPAIANGDGDVQYSLSHSGELALVAMTRGCAVGIDIERIRSIDAPQISARFFSHAERTALASVHRADGLAAFFRCWTRKESFVKGTGDGLSFPLDGFDVSIDEGVTNALMRCHADPSAMCRWTIVPLQVDEGYVAALTIEGRHRDVSAWDAPPL
jgi:4'-phosphopantetheinyl transferase